MEEAGFEPPVIFSRVVGAGVAKERPRFIPQQSPQQQLQQSASGDLIGEMSAPLPPQLQMAYTPRMQQQQQHQLQGQQPSHSMSKARLFAPHYTSLPLFDLIPFSLGQSQFESEYHQHSSQQKPPQQFYHTQQHHQSPMGQVLPQSHQDDGCTSVVSEPASISGCYSGDLEAVGNGGASVSYQDCQSQYVISENQSTHYSTGFLPPSYSRAHQPMPSTAYAPSSTVVASGSCGRIEYPQSVPPHPSHLYEQQQQLPTQQQQRQSPYMHAQTPQYNPYSVPPQSPYPSHHPHLQSHSDMGCSDG